jgi:Na+/proline symporter
VFYLFNTPPMLFNRVYDAQVASGPRAAEYAGLQQTFDREIAARREAALRADRDGFIASDARVKDIRSQASGIVRSASGDADYSDVNYVFPTFITTQLPIGLVGLMIAAIFAAAMSASGGELNALATATVIDFYKRHFVKQATDSHYVFVSKLATFAWGLFACFVAMRAANQGSLIEVVNRYGSVVYGSLLGVFILAILTRRATARGAFWGTIAGMAAVLYVYNWMPWIAFLWHNLIGAVVVVAVGMAISYSQRPDARPV